MQVADDDQARSPPPQQAPCSFQLSYLEGHGDLVSRLIMGIIRMIIWLIEGLLTYLLGPRDPPSKTPKGCHRSKVRTFSQGSGCMV